MNDPEDTIAAIATAAGKGGIGIVRLSGPRSNYIASQICGAGLVPRQVKYCAFRNSNKQLIDRGIVIFFQAPASYTGEDVVELQGHGGQAIMQALLEECLLHGARLAGPGEFTERAYHNDRIDLLQAEAVADLINSQTSESARSAMRSLDGEFSDNINRLVTEIEELRVFTESALDFPEEEIDFIKESDLGSKILGSLGRVGSILESARQGRVMLEGASIGIVGEPNVGKSSLLNRLSQIDRAIVSEQPGTTRDALEQNIVLEGVPLSITDTAGIRETTDEIEREGINRAMKAAKHADLVLLVKEASADIDAGLEQLLSESLVLEVINKIDLVQQAARAESEQGRPDRVYVSAKTGEGIELLKEKIVAYLVPHSEERALPGRTRHLDALEKTRAELLQALDHFDGSKPAAELIAEDLLQAKESLETITGRTVADDLLGKIFSSFCIGK